VASRKVSAGRQLSADPLGCGGILKRVGCAVALLLLLFGCSPAADGRESPGDKREWSILQSLEYQAREQHLDPIQFRVIEEFEIVGIQRVGDPSVIWIMLNPSSPPFYKQMPQGNYALSSEQFQAIITGHRVTSTVEEVLRSHVQ
jgi:hypothetical protein